MVSFLSRASQDILHFGVPIVDIIINMYTLYNIRHTCILYDVYKQCNIIRGGGQMGMGIDGNWLKNSYNLCYDENEHHHRVCRPLISKYSKFQLNLVWYPVVSEIFIFDFDRFFPILTEKMMPKLPIYSSTIGQIIGMGIDGVAPPSIMTIGVIIVYDLLIAFQKRKLLSLQSRKANLKS